MADKNLNELLKWSIENSVPSDNNNNNNNSNNNAAPSQAAGGGHRTALNAEALAQIMGAPSDAELMAASMAHITSADPGVTLESRLAAFDNLEQLVESLDNANLLATLGLWTPLLALLGHDQTDLRRMAAWCVGTAVQNNVPCQERLVALGGVEKLVAMALGRRVGGSDGDAATEVERGSPETQDVRRKAVYALSSAVRNYQPAMDVCAAELRKKGETVAGKIDATDMDAVDEVINALKQKALSA
ncbi:Fes1-domain-containing protein [Xylariaceae sp. FL0662B]|nr:Fes1-domain-containing protein [Xylariaceae sp. FL0662B]